MKMLKPAIIGIGLGIGSLVFASNLHKLKPGMWKYEVTTSVKGMPIAMPARRSTYKKCLTQKDTKNIWKSSSESKGETCSYTNIKATSNHVSWTMECTGNANMKGQGQLTLESSTAYHGIMDMMMKADGHTMNTQLKFSGHRIGHCGKG